MFRKKTLFSPPIRVYYLTRKTKLNDICKNIDLYHFIFKGHFYPEMTDYLRLTSHHNNKIRLPLDDF